MSHTHDKFLTGSAEKEEAFLRHLSALLHTYGIDDRVNAPGYALANHLRDTLASLRHTLHMHFFPRGARSYCQGAPYPWGELTADETVELALDVRNKFMNSFPKTAEVAVRCFNCDGKGYIVPLKATDAPTLKRWQDEYRQSAQVEIDITKLSDVEKASILHAYDWSDEAPDTPLQRAGRRLMQDKGSKPEDPALTAKQQSQLGQKLAERPFIDNKSRFDETGTRYDLNEGGGACSQ